MNTKNLLINRLKKFAFVTCVALAIFSESRANVVSNVVNGATSIDVTINTPRTGKLYYVLSTVNLNSPSASVVKQTALSSTTTSSIRVGSLSFTLNDLNVNETLLMANLPSGQSFFLYCVYENDASGLEIVESFTLFLPQRQPGITYITTVAGQAGTTAQYLLYKPEVAYKNPTQPQPLLLFFHGDGEKGTDINLVKRNGPPRLINEGQELGFIVASPQINWPIYWDRPGYLEELVARLKATQNIDTNRIYITGLSGGGGGIYYYTGNYPTKVAAMIPVSAVNILSNPCSIKDIAFWGFHNLNDPTVSVNNLNVVVNGINACVPHALVAPLETIYPVSGHDSWTVTYYNQQIYAWLLTKTKNSKLNIPPVVNAGADQKVNSYAYLSGTATDDQSISKYYWEKVSGPEATILNRNQASASVKDLETGNYVFRLTVTDNAGATVTDDISIVSSITAQNQAPFVSAGLDINTVLSELSITLTGTAVDPDGSIASVIWTKTSGSPVTLSNTTTTSLILSNVLTGNYIFRFTATDNQGAVAFDEMNLTVIPPVVINQAPIVSAGVDLNTTLTSNAITLTGTATDTDGYIASKLWTKTSGPPVTLSNATTTSLILSNVLTGNYIFRFTATDNQGAVAFDEMNLTVIPPVVVNQAPIVSAGADLNTTLTSNAITLTGTATDANGYIASKLWTQISGSAVTLSNTTTNSLIVTNVLTGNYIFRFTATDNLGSTAYSNVNVTVVAPIASVVTNSGNGLNFSYFNNISLTGIPVWTGVDSSINYNWGAGSPNPAVTINTFSARWLGQVLAPISGSVVFSTTSDDGVRLWVNNVLLIDNWNPHASTVNTASVTLTQGQLYNIKIEYYEFYGNALVSLAWSYTGQNTQIIPAANLFLPSSNSRMEANNDDFQVTNKLWNIYPNPVSKVLYIQSVEQETIVSIALKNVMGQEVYRLDNQTEATILSIPVNGFQSGIYFLDIITNTEKVTKRIVVE